MEVWQAIALSVIEGITEFIPVSSTGHMVLFSHLFSISDDTFVKTFEIVVQLGALGALVGRYARKIWDSPRLILIMVGGFVPTGLMGLLFYDNVKAWLSDPMVVVWALGIGGVVILAWENWCKLVKTMGQTCKDLESPNLKLEELGFKRALVIGLFQSLALIPGVSRSLVSIMGARAMGLSRVEAVEMSFLLSMPTIFAASGLDLVRTGYVFGRYEWGLLGLGFLISFITAKMVVNWLLGFVKKNDFTWFGIYRIILAIVYFFLVL